MSTAATNPQPGVVTEEPVVILKDRQLSTFQGVMETPDMTVLGLRDGYVALNWRSRC